MTGQSDGSYVALGLTVGYEFNLGAAGISRRR